MDTRVKIGDTFGNWEVIQGPTRSNSKIKQWTCRCTCSREKAVSQYNLIAQRSTNCGCQPKGPMKESTKELLAMLAKDRPAPRPKGSFNQSQETKDKISATKRANKGVSK